MSRNIVIAIGVLLWVSFGIVVLFHVLVMEDWMAPVFAVAVVTAVVVAYHARQRALKTS